METKKEIEHFYCGKCEKIVKGKYAFPVIRLEETTVKYGLGKKKKKMTIYWHFEYLCKSCYKKVSK